MLTVLVHGKGGEAADGRVAERHHLLISTEQTRERRNTCQGRAAGPVSSEAKASSHYGLEKLDEVHRTAWGWRRPAAGRGLSNRAWEGARGEWALCRDLALALPVLGGSPESRPQIWAGGHQGQRQQNSGQFGELGRKRESVRLGRQGEGGGNRRLPQDPFSPVPRLPAGEQGVRRPRWGGGVCTGELGVCRLRAHLEGGRRPTWEAAAARSGQAALTNSPQSEAGKSKVRVRLGAWGGRLPGHGWPCPCCVPPPPQ